jgi:hypothetical protein
MCRGRATLENPSLPKDLIRKLGKGARVAMLYRGLLAGRCSHGAFCGWARNGPPGPEATGKDAVPAVMAVRGRPVCPKLAGSLS